MMRRLTPFAPLLLLWLPAASSGFGQAPATPAAAHRRPTTGTAAAPGMGANAPGIPKVTALPKTLFTLKYVDLVVGTGELAVPRKWYTVNYTGWLTTGKKFDSSYDRGEPITFPYGARRVIAGWDTGFEGMRIGGKRRLLIPYELAYGEAGNQVIPAKSNLIFDVELLAMSDTPPAPKAPPAGAVPPAGAAPGSKPAPPTTPTTPTTPTPTTPTTPTSPTTPTTPPTTPTTPTTPSIPPTPTTPSTPTAPTAPTKPN